VFGQGDKMDIDSLTKGLGFVSSAITTLKSLKELIPSGDKKQHLEHKLEEAEENMKIAEAEIAKGFNYQLCHRHFPPGIMLEIAPFRSKCNTCGNIEDYDS
jgi:Na+-translocating ferredoxin:NAD+ oxidoreductase RnfE subunit